MTEIYGVDASFDELSLDEAQRLKDVGVKVWMQCLWTAATAPTVRVNNLRNAINVGLIPVGYISINAYQPGNQHVDRALDGFPDDLWDTLQMVEIDVELEGIQAPDIRSAVNRVRELGQKQVAIYTSYNAWVNYVIPSNPTSFTDCLLHNALWDKAPDIDFPSLPFGGWTLDQVVAEQWSGGGYVEGVFVDRNTFVKELLLPEGETMPSEDQRELAAAKQALERQLQFRYVSSLFAEATTTAIWGNPLRPTLAARLRYLLALPSS